MHFENAAIAAVLGLFILEAAAGEHAEDGGVGAIRGGNQPEAVLDAVSFAEVGVEQFDHAAGVAEHFAHDARRVVVVQRVQQRAGFGFVAEVARLHTVERVVAR